MPTGYTAMILDAKEPVSFKDFALQCARAFGALVTMRDDDLSAEIPDEIKPSDYHGQRLEELHKEKERLLAQGVEGLKKTASAEYIDQIQTTLKHDCETRYYSDKIAKLKAKIESFDAETYRKTKLEDIECGIAYHLKENLEEIKRCASRTKWIQDLKKSLETVS